MTVDRKLYAYAISTTWSYAQVRAAHDLVRELWPDADALALVRTYGPELAAASARYVSAQRPIELLKRLGL